MSANWKQQVVDLLKALETGDPKPFSYINPNKYIQHNLDVADGPAGVAALVRNLPSGTKVNTIRAFQSWWKLWQYACLVPGQQSRSGRAPD